MSNQRLEQLTQALSKLPVDKIDQVETLINSLGKRALSVKEAAQMLNVCTDTVKRAIKSGRIKAFRINKQGSYRIAMEEIDQFMKIRS